MTSDPLLKETSADLGDLKKWPKLHWGGDRPSSPPVAAPMGWGWGA